MFERIRFVRYALKFERAFRTDRWDEVQACFHPEAVYTIAGSGTSWDGDYRGPEAIVGCFQRMLDEVDRKYDRRKPRLTGFPRVRGGALHLSWKVHYIKGPDTVTLDGTTRFRFRDGLIVELYDTMVADQIPRCLEVVGVTDAARSISPT